MADPWLDHPAGKEVLEQATAAIGWDVVEKSRDPEALARTEIVQPAVFACDLAAFAVLRAEGVPCHAAAGHSLGEYAALVAAGALPFQLGLATVAIRAAAMANASDDHPGTMTAILGLTLEDAQDLCDVAGRGDVLQVANENAAKQVVLSGSIPAIERAEALARDRGAKAIRLQVAGAFHSPLMSSAVQPVREAISRIGFQPPAFPIVPNASAKPTTQPLVLRDLLGRHLSSSVRWDASMHAMAGIGIDWFIEAGPGDVLGKLARRAVPGATVRSVGNPAQAREVADQVRRSDAAGSSGVGSESEVAR
jgi:[acyl-carrier-protein] S-malonyltransferase